MFTTAALIFALSSLDTAEAASVSGAAGVVAAAPAVGLTVEGSAGSRWVLEREIGVWATRGSGGDALLGALTGNLTLTRALEVGQRSTVGPSVAADLGLFTASQYIYAPDADVGCAQPPCLGPGGRGAAETRGASGGPNTEVTTAADLAAGATWRRAHPDGSGKGFELSVMLQPTASYGPDVVLPRLDMSWTTRGARHVGLKASRHATFLEWGRVF